MKNQARDLFGDLQYAWWSSLTPLVNSRLVAVPSPFHLTYVVSHRCNARCVMCHLWQEKDNQDMSAEKVRRIFSDNNFSSLTALTLTGGEPTLRRDLAELLGIIAHACPQLRQVTLATNGLNPQRTVEQVNACIEAIPIDSSIKRFTLQVSLDGVGEVHDQIRGIPGFYDRVMETVHLLKDLERGEHRLSLKLSSTIQPANVDFVGDVRALAKQVSIPVRFGATVLSPHYYNNIDDQHLRFTPEQAKRAAAHFIELAETSPEDSVKFYYRDAARMMLGAQRGKVCMMGFYGCVLEYDGRVFPCVNCEIQAFGNLQEKPFRDLWWGKQAEALRRDMRRRCCPTCTSICSAMPDNIVKVLDLFWHRFSDQVRAKSR